jgi:septation ring formation regulator EzrA
MGEYFFRSESSTTSSDEFKHVKALINELQNELEDSHEKNDTNFDSITSTLNTLQTRFEQMETRSERSRKDMIEVSFIYSSSRISMFRMRI